MFSRATPSGLVVDTSLVRTWVVVIALLVVLACSDARSTSDEPTVEPDRGAEPACVDPPDWPVGGSGRLVVDTDLVAPGDDVAFRWDVAKGMDFLVGDELFVECWAGNRWESVWIAGGVFGPDPFAVLLTAQNRDNVVVTQDGWTRTEGVLPVPEDVRPGVYRVVAEINLRAEGSGRPAIESHVAYLVVES